MMNRIEVDVKPFPALVMLVMAQARQWLSVNVDASRVEKRAYREAVNDVLCAMQRYEEAEILRRELARMFFPPYEERNGD